MSSEIKTNSDFFVKYLFGREQVKDLTISFINAVLDDSGFPIMKSLEIKNPFNLKTFIAEKESILDIKATDESGRPYDIEMQVSGSLFFKSRSLYYWSKLYLLQIGEGERYHLLKPTICINLLDFRLIN